MGATTPMNLGPGLAAFPGTSEIVDGALSGGCESKDGKIVVIPTDSNLALIFGTPNHDLTVVAFFGCTMSRTKTAARQG